MKRILFTALALLMTVILTGALADGYRQGDTINDFEVVTPEGETLSLSGLLETHDAVMLNFWFADCSWCTMEFPFLQAAWEEQTSVAVLALTPYDSDAAITAYREKMGLTFPMARDAADLAIEFGVTGFPTSVMIDRNGVWCATESTTLEISSFRRFFETFSGEDYTESKVGYELPEMTPDAPEFPGHDAFAESYGTDQRIRFAQVREAWPFVMGEDGRAALPGEIPLGTTAALGLTVEAAEGDALLIEMDLSTAGGKSFVCAAVDGETVKRWSGHSAVTDALVLTEGSHSVTLYYQRGYYAGPFETMKLKEIRLLSGEEAVSGLNSIRRLPAAKRSMICPVGGTEIRYFQNGEPMAFRGDMQAYLIDPEHKTLRITLEEGLDPYTMMLNAVDDYALADMETDDTGFLVSLKTDEPAVVAQVYDALTGQTAAGVLLLSGEYVADMLAAQFGEDVTWEKVEAVPVITVMDEEGNPVAGVRLSLCEGENCRVMLTDESGTVRPEMETDALHVQVLMVPQGYTAAQSEYDLTGDAPQLNIVLEKKE